MSSEDYQFGSWLRAPIFQGIQGPRRWRTSIKNVRGSLQGKLKDGNSNSTKKGGEKRIQPFIREKTWLTEEKSNSHSPMILRINNLIKDKDGKMRVKRKKGNGFRDGNESSPLCLV